jgi:hydrogenase nickel incorporation protein HypA/HybF
LHEVAIVQTLIEQIEAEVDRAGATGHVERVELVVGHLSGACADSIRFAFELLAPESPLLEKAELVIDEPKAICHCQKCDAQTMIDELLPSCPKCGSVEIRIEGGQDLLLQTIEIEEDEEQSV